MEVLLVTHPVCVNNHYSTFKGVLFSEVAIEPTKNASFKKEHIFYVDADLELDCWGST